mmetsp:Transcript_22390/g.51933  ORF Transcript_22390/g.51933 Transcript_22390/m.51933 type:complete len:137 (+) Transcript_22390:95-505(+)
MGAKLATSCCAAAEPDEVMASEFYTDNLGKPVFYNDDSLIDEMVKRQANGGLYQARADSQRYSPFCWKGLGSLRLGPEQDEVPAGRIGLRKLKDWNSAEFLRELNRQAKSLSMEFQPLQPLPQLGAVVCNAGGPGP